MHKIPTVFIGIGGVGCKIAGKISKMVSDESRRYVGFIGIDTDKNAIDKCKAENYAMTYIQTSGDWDVNEFLDKHPDDEKWFPEENILRLRKMLAGAGQIRPLSRLTFISSQEENAFAPIAHEIQRVREVDGIGANNLVIVIVGSITGGTGAGMFIQLPFLLRNMIKTQMGGFDYTIRGMFVGSDITCDVQPEDFMRDNVMVNAYTCLKELNAFNIHHIVESDMPDVVTHSLELENYDNTDLSPDNVPYNYIYLYENSSSKGTIGETEIDEFESYIANIAYGLLFTPIGPNAASIEDNYILDSIRKNNRNRYVGAGTCKLKYPVDEAQKYVTLSLVNDLVKNEWLYLDDRFNEIYIEARERQLSDHKVTLPILSEVYVDGFEKESKGASDLHLLAKFTDEAYRLQKKPGTAEEEYVSKASDFLRLIDERVATVMQSDTVKEAKEKCKLKTQDMDDFEYAVGEVKRVWEAMGSYINVADTTINDEPAGIIIELFPDNVSSMDQRKASTSCIYSYLANVHPVVARFLIYDMINQLKSKKTEYEKLIKEKDTFAYLNEDFDRHRDSDGIQDPSTALGNIQSRGNSLFRDVLRLLNGGDKAAIRPLKDQLRKATEKHISIVTSDLECKLKLIISTKILQRLELLSKEYEAFFKTIRRNVRSNSESLSDLTKIYFPFGTEGVYCSESAFEKMAEQFKNANAQSLDLTLETKNAIFDELFKIYATKEADKRKVLSETEEERKRHSEANEEALESVFENAVVKTIKGMVIDNGADIVNLTVKQAIEREAEINSGDEEKLNNYLVNRMNKALAIASPMITLTNEGRNNNELIFMAVSPRNAIQYNKKNTDTTPTRDYYLGDSVNRVNDKKRINALVDSDFNDQELVLIKITYGHLVEDLSKYQPGSDNYNAYVERINKLEEYIESGVSIDHDVEVCPHLNKYWYEEGFVPSMHIEQRKQDKKDLRKAFIMGLGYDCFVMRPYKDRIVDNQPILKWCVNSGNLYSTTIMKQGDPIGTDYVDLYNSLLFNRSIKKKILSFSEQMKKNVKGYRSATSIAEDILNDGFIRDLANSDGSTEKGEQNIFDVFIEMYSTMKSDEWVALVLSLRDILLDMFKYYFNNDLSLTDKTFKVVLEEIYNHSSLNGMSGNEMKERHSKMFDIYNSFMNEYYD